VKPISALKLKGTRRILVHCEPHGITVIEWLTLLICIEEIPASDLGLETGYPD
jgi:hypothetical protein